MSLRLRCTLYGSLRNLWLELLSITSDRGSCASPLRDKGRTEQTEWRGAAERRIKQMGRCNSYKKCDMLVLSDVRKHLEVGSADLAHCHQLRPMPPFSTACQLGESLFRFVNALPVWRPGSQDPSIQYPVFHTELLPLGTCSTGYSGALCDSGLLAFGSRRAWQGPDDR